MEDEDAEIAGEFTDKISSLKFELAKAFLPVLDSIVNKLINNIIPAIKRFIDAWNNLSSKTKSFVGVLLTMLAVIGPIMVVVGKVIPLILKVKEAFTAVSGAVKTAGASITFSTLGWIALIAVIEAVLLQNEKFRAVLKKLLEMIGQIVSKLMGFISQIVDALIPIVEQLMELINVVIDVLVELIEKLLVPL